MIVFPSLDDMLRISLRQFAQRHGRVKTTASDVINEFRIPEYSISVVIVRAILVMIFLR